MTTESDDIPALYERHADAWVHARLRESTLYEKSWLDRFSALLPPTASVLDCGCGAGQPIAAYLTHLGHAVLGIDASPSMVQKFQTGLPTQRALVADMRTLDLNETFHGILAWDSFFHLTPTDQRNIFANFCHHAAPHAALMFTSGSLHGVAIGQLEGDPLYHASLDTAEYRQLLDDHGFDVIEHREKDETCGDRTIWLACLR